MRLISLRARNFRLHAATHVEFPTGVIGIVGGNESGKSALVEAALFALFGTEATRGTKAGLRWHGAAARSPAEVVLVFEVGGVTYQVERSETDATLRTAGTGYRILAQGTKPVNEAVPKLLGMAFTEFAASYLCLQKDLVRLAAMGPTERETFVRRVMGVELVDDALKRCRKRKSAIGSECDGMAAGLGDRDPIVAYLDTAAVALEDAEGAVEVTRRDLEVAQARQKEARARLDRSNVTAQEHRRLLEQERAVLSAIAAIEIEAELVATSIAEHGAETERRRAALVASLEERRADVATLRAKLAERRVAAEFDQAALAAAERALEGAQDHLMAVAAVRHEKLAEKLSDFATAAKLALSVRANIRRIEGFGVDGVCPTCTRALGDAFAGTLAGLTKAAVEHEDAARQAEAEADELRKETPEELSATVARDAADAEVRRLGELYRVAASHALEAGRLEGLLAGADRREREHAAALSGVDQDGAARLARLEARLAELGQRPDVGPVREQIAALGFDQTVHDVLISYYDQHVARVASGTVAVARAEERIAAAARTHADERRRLAEHDDRAAKLAERMADYVRHEKVDVGLAGLRTAVAGTIRPEMEELVSGFVNLLTDGRHESVELTPDFAVIPQEAGESAEVVSGGTEDIVALAMRLAISQMIAERAGHPLSLLVLDEPFGSLDAVRRAAFVNLIRQLRGTFEQVLVISHVEETRDMVDHVIELAYDEAAGCTHVVDAEGR